jgi:hypothetical protein
MKRRIISIKRNSTVDFFNEFETKTEYNVIPQMRDELLVIPSFSWQGSMYFECIEKGFSRFLLLFSF